MRSLIAYTDGACSGNPGPGGWGVVLQAKSGSGVTKQRELKGGAQETTNNRMELMAAISALEALSRSSTITVVTDSVYVKDGVTKWIFGWKKNGWKTAAKKPVKNEDLWKQLDAAQAQHAGHLGMGQRPRRPPRKRTGRRTWPALEWRLLKGRSRIRI